MLSVLAYGVSHRQLPIAHRERWAVTAQALPGLLAQLKANQVVEEAVLLSTCNRTELYVVTEDRAQVLDWFVEHCGAGCSSTDWPGYVHESLASARHLMRLACGLDSAIVGEPQVLGQIKAAYGLACSEGLVGSQLRHLFPAAFSVGKSIRHETAVGARAVTLAYALVQLSRRFYSDLSSVRVLVVGASDTNALVMTHLRQQGVTDITLVNRHVGRGEAMARTHQVRFAPWSNMDACLEQVDWVITATQAEQAIITRDHIQKAFSRRRHLPMLMTDLALPRDIDPEVGSLKDVYLYHLDDIQQLIADNQAARRDAAAQAESMIQVAAEHYCRQARVQAAGDTIGQFRAQAFSMKEACLEKWSSRLKAGMEADEALARLADDLTRRLLHAPTVKLREAVSADHAADMACLSALFSAPNDD